MWYVKGFTFVYFHFQDKRCQKVQKNQNFENLSYFDFDRVFHVKF